MVLVTTISCKDHADAELTCRHRIYRRVDAGLSSSAILIAMVGVNVARVLRDAEKAAFTASWKFTTVFTLWPAGTIKRLNPVGHDDAPRSSSAYKGAADDILNGMVVRLSIRLSNGKSGSSDPNLSEIESMPAS